MPYFDHNATTPLCPPAREAWLRVQDTLWHNASSLYREAAAARDELERCRERLAELLGDDRHPESIVFTSGATEGCNGIFRAYAEWIRTHPDTPWRTIISPFEHPAVREPAVKFCRAEVLDRGRLEPLLESGHETTRGLLVAWMAANNETGEIFPWHDWTAPVSQGKAHRLFCDASQWFGKLPAQGFQSASPSLNFVGSAHKFGGPKAVGFFRLGCQEALGHWSWQLGGPQENGARAGTEDVAGVAAMVAALEWSEDQMPGDPAPRDKFESKLGWSVVAGDRPRLWNTSMVVAPRHDNRLWLARLSHRGFQCSTGSACSSGKDGDSLVLAAMGLPPDHMKRVLRFSSGWTTTPDDWRALATALHEVLHDLDRRNQKPET